MLFTHRGLSGPAILQISSYWNDGESIHVDLLPDADLATIFADARKHSPKRQLGKLLESHLPARLAQWLANGIAASTNLANVSAGTTEELAERIHNWSCVPAGTEGFRTAEVTRGGVSTNALSSKTMETREIPGLFFIGEVVDVTGHLGGFNFQWAWSSGHAAGQVA